MASVSVHAARRRDPLTGAALRRVCGKAADTLRLGWCKGHLALDGRNAPAWPPGKLAQSWCLMGAVDRACVEEGLDVHAYHEVLERVCGAIGLPDEEALGDWNDAPDRVRADVTRALSDASLGIWRVPRAKDEF